MNCLPETVTRQRRGCNLNPGPAPESSTLNTRLLSHEILSDLACLTAARETNTHTHARTHTHTHPYNGPFSRTTWVSRYQKGETNLDFTGARDSEWQWHQLGHMQVCTSLQTDNHASTPPLCFLQAGCPSIRGHVECGWRR